MSTSYLQGQRMKMHRFFKALEQIEANGGTRFILTYAKLIPEELIHQGVYMRRVTCDEQMEVIKSHHQPFLALQLGSQNFIYVSKKWLFENCPDKEYLDKVEAHKRFCLKMKKDVEKVKLAKLKIKS